MGLLKNFAQIGLATRGETLSKNTAPKTLTLGLVLHSYDSVDETSPGLVVVQMRRKSGADRIKHGFGIRI